MHATVQAHCEEDFDEGERVSVEGRIDPRAEDSFWQREYRWEDYFSRGFEYEDYAPAYCVGYVGYAQYGGEFGDAEKSLCANWERIKGDSRLTLEQALPAMHAAWNRMAHPRTAVAAASRLARRIRKLRPRAAPVRFSPSLVR